MKRLSVLSILLVLAYSGPAAAAQIVSVAQSADQVPLYEMIEFSIVLDTAYENPYDPEQADVYAEITPPGGGALRVDAFWFEPYTSSLDGDHEVFAAAGSGEWRVRYAPVVEGIHTWHVIVKDDSGEAVSGDQSFTAAPAGSHGFIRVNPDNPRYFAFDDGTSYVPLGVDVCWAREPAGYYAYAGYLDALAAGGGNWTRLWMSHFAEGTALEWGAYHPTGYYQGLGRYSQQVAGKLDAIFTHALEKGIAIQLVFHQHSQFECSMWSSWPDNPYNAANGGPCATSADYFTNPMALTLSQKLHRYIVARYAAFRSVMAWEIWNEADLITGVGMDLMVPWTQDAAAFVRGKDPAGHLVTTSYAIPLALPWYDISTWDFNNRHEYEYGSWINGLFIKPYFNAGSPLLLSEFGIDFTGDMNARDPLGVNMHNGIWSTLMHGYAGGAMNWWWDDYVAPNNLWSLNLAPAAFIGDADMSAFKRDASLILSGDGLESAGIVADRGEEKEFWIWVHDLSSDWWGPMDDIAPVESARLTVQGGFGLVTFDWSGEIWDTWSGQTSGTIPLTRAGDAFSFELPVFQRDIAVKLFAQTVADDDTDDDDADDSGDDTAVTDDSVGPDDSANDDTAAALDDESAGSSEKSPCGC